ncbi:MAG: ATP-binding protein [Cyanobacteria bacterium P01_G01_bin.54]
MSAVLKQPVIGIQSNLSQMSTQAKLYFLCGKMAAGKSTLAKQLARDHDAILLIEDDLLTHLYSKEITDIPSYVEYSSRLKAAISDHICSLLSKGISVVLDFPGNTKRQRQWFRGLFERANIAHELHFIDVSNDLCKRQLKERSKDKPNGTAFTSDAEFEAITKYFQAPTYEEGFNIIRHERA